MIEEERKRELEAMRHSASHVMAEAVQALFPGAKFGIGPTVEGGFYYDFDLPRPLAPADLEKIESRMKESVAADLPFRREEVDVATARRLFADQPYKLELVEELRDEPLSVYRQGGFTDLCRGPHVASTGRIGAFKLLSVAGAYWRGDENRPMLQRIYSTAFFTQRELDEHLRRLDEAARRDHRRLGKDLDLFSVHPEVGAGLLLYHPNLGRVRTVVEDFWRSEHYRHGYEIVYTPHIGRAVLWERSGHLGYFTDDMYPPMELDNAEYYLKPMNCPFHILIYESAMRSYRDLPMRLAELGTVYRYERPGVLHGLLRTRGFTQDDAHIFCRPDQIEDEVIACIDLSFFLLGAFGLHEYEIYLSTRPAKAVGEVEAWEDATRALRQALARRGLSYAVDEGGGSFYGPKIDIKIKDARGRAWQCTTIQFDFNLPERFDLTYVGEDGEEHRPHMIHRALLGSLERFLGVLVEHYGGALPVWLAPVQAVVIPIADRHNEYAARVEAQLRDAGLRTNADTRSERMNLKIREAQLQKVPYMLVVGDAEVAGGKVAVRLRSGENRGPMAIEEFLRLALDDIAARR